MPRYQITLKTMSLNDFGKKWLVEDCQKIEMKEILQETKKQLLQQLLHAQIEAYGIQTEILHSPTGNGGKRWWFACPQCNKRKGVLYKHPFTTQIACRDCLQLRYKKQAKHKMIEEKTF